LTNYVKVSGTWRAAATHYVKVAGTWRTATYVYTKTGDAWKQSIPWVPRDTSLASFTMNGTSVLGQSTYNAPSGTTSVVVAATATDPTATVTGTGTFSVSYANNGLAGNNITVRVTAQAGNYTDYTVAVVVAATTYTTIYFAYCNGGSVVSSSAQYQNPTTVTTACASQQSALGNPTNWTCAGSAVTPPTCVAPGPFFPPYFPPTCSPTSYFVVDCACGYTCALCNTCYGHAVYVNADCSTTNGPCVYT
jgi:hypothetical protein